MQTLLICYLDCFAFFFKKKDIFVQKSTTFIAILDLCLKLMRNNDIQDIFYYINVYSSFVLQPTN